MNDHDQRIELQIYRDNESVLITVPPLPNTKFQLQWKNVKLRKELDTVRRQYRENVYDKVIENFKKQCDEAKYDITPSYGKLKELIKSSTSDEVLEGCRVPEHKHSIQNKRIYCCKCNCSISEKLRFIVFSC